MNPPESYIGEVVEAGPLDGHWFAMGYPELVIPVWQPVQAVDGYSVSSPVINLTYRFVEGWRDGVVAYGRWVSDRPAAA